MSKPQTANDDDGVIFVEVQCTDQLRVVAGPLRQLPSHLHPALFQDLSVRALFVKSWKMHGSPVQTPFLSVRKVVAFVGKTAYPLHDFESMYLLDAVEVGGALPFPSKRVGGEVHTLDLARLGLFGETRQPRRLLLPFSFRAIPLPKSFCRCAQI
jgi:hypothetical protein